MGGPHGYQEFLEVIFDPKHREYEHYVRWAGGHFVDTFDLAAVNDKLTRMQWPVRHRRYQHPSVTATRAQDKS